MQPYGGFWLRFVAYVIDAIVLQIAGSVLGMIAGLGIGAGSLAGPDASEWIAGGSIIGLVGLNFIGTWLYFALMEASATRGTLGKKALGLVVTDLAGERIGFGRATGRYFAKFLSTLILLFGFFMVGWTQRKQGLHDLLAGTLVYKASAAEEVTTSARVFE